MPRLAALQAVLLAAGCLSNSGGFGSDRAARDDAGLLDGGARDLDASSGESVCERWLADRADLAEGAWSGSAASCDPGEILEPGPENALRLVNLYRYLAGLAPVIRDPALDAAAQACALMMHAEGRLSHDPTTDWACYSAQGADGAARSLEDLAPVVAAIDVYMIDPGNETTLGHRRNILSQWLQAVGIGSTDRASCLSTDIPSQWIEGFIAWPPPGQFPMEAIEPLPWLGSLDDVGWSIQTTTIDLAAAEVTVRNAQDDVLPVEVWQLEPGYGSSYAIAIRPTGWSMQPGTYRVDVAGVDPPIAYEFQVVDCR